jgi:hypothetical protein
VHTKGVVLEGVFTAAPEARTIVKTPIFSGGPLPIVVRFSLFAGLPDLPDNADAASPARESHARAARPQQPVQMIYRICFDYECCRSSSVLDRRCRWMVCCWLILPVMF